jgi:hypothetical protein
LGFWKDHADPGPERHDIDILVVDVPAVQADFAGDPAGFTVSFIRFRQRRKVDLPQPEGPIIAITSLQADIDTDLFDGVLLAVIDKLTSRQVMRGSSTKGLPTVFGARNPASFYLRPWFSLSG